jgi:hypothetical protein
LWDARAGFLFFVWSVPFFVAGWVLLGIPAIAMDTQILKLSPVFLGVSGAIAGLFIMLLPTGWLIALGAVQFKLTWSIVTGWDGFGAAIGAIPETWRSFRCPSISLCRNRTFSCPSGEEPSRESLPAARRCFSDSLKNCGFPAKCGLLAAYKWQILKDKDSVAVDRV